MGFTCDLSHLVRKCYTTVNVLLRLVKCQAAAAVLIHLFDPHNNPTEVDAWTSCGYRQSSLMTTWRHRDAEASQSDLKASGHQLTLLSLKPHLLGI